MRHIVLFEPDPSGHRMIFVRYIVEALVKHGGFRATLVTSTQGIAAPWVRELATQYASTLSMHVVSIETGLAGLERLHPKIGGQWANSRSLQTAVDRLRRQGRADYVFIPFADDYCLFPFARRAPPFGPTRWGGIAIRPRFHLRRLGAKVPRRWEDYVEQWAYRRMLRNRSLDVLFTIDPCFAAAFYDAKVRSICDPADIGTVQFRPSLLPFPDETVALLVYGSIDHRKAIDRLLAVAADPRVPHRLAIALVGAQEAGMERILSSPAAAKLRQLGRLFEINRRVDEVEEASAFGRADIVWGYYPGSYCSSGAMVRAGQTGTALLATQEGLVGHITKSQCSGLVAPEDDDEALLGQLVLLTEDAELRQRLGKAGLRHFASATSAAFGEAIVNHLANVVEPTK